MKLVSTSLAALLVVLLLASAAMVRAGATAAVESESESDSELEMDTDSADDADAEGQELAEEEQTALEGEGEDLSGDESTAAAAADAEEQGRDMTAEDAAELQQQSEAEALAQRQSEASTAEEAAQLAAGVEPWTAEGRVLEVGGARVDGEGIAAFKDVVGQHIPAMVEFYIPTCGHCQGFVPEYERLAKTFAGQPVLIARVDAHRWNKLADEYHVSRVPDIRYFPKGSKEPQEYRRPRALEDLTMFLNDYAGTNIDIDAVMLFKQLHSPLTGQSVAEKRLKNGYCPVH